MKTAEMSFFDWQKRFSTDQACAHYLAKQRWPNGFQCPSCGHDHGCFLKSRRLYECTRCGHQTSVTAGTLFHATKLPLTRWFWAIYWIGADKVSLSAGRLTTLIGVSWPTAFAIVRKLRQAMGRRDTRDDTKARLNRMIVDLVATPAMRENSELNVVQAWSR